MRAWRRFADSSSSKGGGASAAAAIAAEAPPRSGALTTEETVAADDGGGVRAARAALHTRSARASSPRSSRASISAPYVSAHTTPVLLAIGERAELATDEYLPLTSVLEGVVILKENPDYVPTEFDEKKKDLASFIRFIGERTKLDPTRPPIHDEF